MCSVSYARICADAAIPSNTGIWTSIQTARNKISRARRQWESWFGRTDVGTVDLVLSDRNGAVLGFGMDDALFDREYQQAAPS